MLFDDGSLSSYEEITGSSTYTKVATISRQTQYTTGLTYYVICTSGGSSCSQGTSEKNNFYNNIEPGISYPRYLAYWYDIDYNQYYGVSLKYECQRSFAAGYQCGTNYQTGTLNCSGSGTQVTQYKCPSGWTAYPSNSSKCYKAATK